MKKIKLTQGKYALVDDEDFDYLNQFKWYLSSGERGGYATRTVYLKNGKITRMWMHRILNKTLDRFETDHIDRNKLNNQKNNLRTVTQSQNNFNRGLRRNNKSGIKGVYWDSGVNMWRAQIRINGHAFNLGKFDKLEEAASIYNKRFAEAIHIPPKMPSTQGG